MVTLTLSDKQVVDLVKQLPPEAKQAILEALVGERELWWDLTLSCNEDRLRNLANDRGRSWEEMSEEERESFVDQILHEKP